ncbi:MAG: hypothetical protein OHK0057_25150 [Thermoflexibacter sp.]
MLGDYSKGNRYTEKAEPIRLNNYKIKVLKLTFAYLLSGVSAVAFGGYDDTAFFQDYHHFGGDFFLESASYS